MATGVKRAFEREVRSWPFVEGADTLSPARSALILLVSILLRAAIYCGATVANTAFASVWACWPSSTIR